MHRKNTLYFLKAKKRGGGNHKSDFQTIILSFTQKSALRIRHKRQWKMSFTFKAENHGGWAKKILKLKKPLDFSNGLQMDIRFCVTFGGVFFEKSPNALGIGAIVLS